MPERKNLHERIQLNLFGIFSKFLQLKYFPPNVSFKIKLRRTSEEFALLWSDSTPKYSIDFENVILYVKRVLVQDSIMHSHQLLMTHHNAVWPFTDTNIKSIPIAKNSVYVIDCNYIKGVSGPW